jgi:hypothetical protein
MAARSFFVCAAAALLLAAPAFAATDVNPRVKPKTGHRGTTFRVAFTAPKAAGHRGVTERWYSVELAVRGRGCSEASVQTVPEAKAGERVKLRFRPPSGHWCLGKGRGTISESEGPYCQPGEMCPEFPTTTREIAHFSFKVVRRS